MAGPAPTGTTPPQTQTSHPLLLGLLPPFLLLRLSFCCKKLLRGQGGHKIRAHRERERERAVPAKNAQGWCPSQLRHSTDSQADEPGSAG